MINIHPNDISPILSRADARAMLKDYNGAIADYTLAIKNKSECVEAYFKRANVRTLKQDLRRAFKDYNQVIKIDPNYALAYVQRGYICKQQGKNQEAIVELKQALSIFHKKSMPNEIRKIQQEIRILENEIRNTPWWKTRIF